MDKFLVGLFDDEEVLIKAVKEVRRSGKKIDDCLTPFPVHGLDEAMGLKESKLHTVGFFAGGTGTLVALSFMIWVNTTSYPLIFGGKPYLSLPSFIPITFELTVLFAAVSMVVAFFARCGLSPFKEPSMFDDRITDDRFAMTFDIHNSSEEEVEELKELMLSQGAVDIKFKDFSEEEY